MTRGANFQIQEENQEENVDPEKCKTNSSLNISRGEYREENSDQKTLTQIILTHTTLKEEDEEKI